MSDHDHIVDYCKTPTEAVRYPDVGLSRGRTVTLCKRSNGGWYVKPLQGPMLTALEWEEFEKQLKNQRNTPPNGRRGPQVPACAQRSRLPRKG